MLVNIQFLRFAAALLVVLYHASSHVRASGLEQGAFFGLSEAIGFAGVDVFFVISGFIMAYTTRGLTGLDQGWVFLRRRAARIYSGYWPFFLLTLIVFTWINPELLESASLARSAVLWPANILLLGVSWTLIFEMFFYLLFTLLLVFTQHQREWALKFLLLGIITWSVFSQFIRHAYDPGQLEYISLAEYYTLSPYLAEFLAGAVLATTIGAQPVKHPAWVLTLGIILFVLGGWINNGLFDGKIEQGYFVFYRVLAFGIPSLLILKGLIGLEQAGHKAPLRFSLVAGGASYAIYLSHTVLLRITQYLGFNEYAGQQGAAVGQILFLVMVVIILLLSIAHCRWIEKPLHQVFKKWLRVA